MEEKKKTKSKTKNKSSVKPRKKIEKSTLSNDELLEQILNKKKKKTVKKEPEKLEIPKYNKQYVDKRLREINKKIKDPSTSSDELYDLLQERKELNKQKRLLKLQEPQVEKEKKPKPVKKVPKVKPKEEPKEEVVVPPEEPVPEVEEPVPESPPIEEFKKEKRKDIILIMILLALLIGLVIGIISFALKDKSDKREDSVVREEEHKEDEEAKERERLAKLYDECLVRPLDERDRTEEIIQAEEELKNFLGKYKISVGYKDLDMGYAYYYNENQVYYAASSVKILAVLYLYNEASKGNLDLETTLKYTSKDRWSASPEMSKVKFGTSLSLRTLSKYTLTVSDNTAYQMLVRYIGRKNIIEFGKSMGAKRTFNGGDNFGNIDVHDALVYWNYVNDFINNNGELGQELKSYMISAEQNGLTLEEYGVEAAHKYGEYSPFYHDNGIVYSNHPYLVSILTREYGKTMISKVKDINEHIYELHLKYYQNRENICKSEVYGN